MRTRQISTRIESLDPPVPPTEARAELLSATPLGAGRVRSRFTLIELLVANHKLFIGKGVAINNGGDPSWLSEVDFTNGGSHQTNIVGPCAGDGPYLYSYGTASVFPP